MLQDFRRFARSAEWTAVTVGALIFVGGFGVLSIFWYSRRYPQVHGLFDYRTANFGYGVLLPLEASLLTYCIHRLPKAQREYAWALATATVAGLLGVATQLIWLATEDSPEIWTVPIPHRFNAAGWYHAAFLSLASAFFTFLTVLAIRRLRLATLSSPLNDATASLFAGLVAGPVAFAFLVMIDGVVNGRASTSMISSVAIVAVGLLTAGWVWWAVGPQRRPDFRAPVKLGVISALGFSVATVPHAVGMDGITTVSIVCCMPMTLALGTPLLRRRPTLWLATTVGIFLVLTGGAVVAVNASAATGSFWLSMALPVPAIAMAAAMARPSPSENDLRGWRAVLTHWATERRARWRVALTCFAVQVNMSLAAWFGMERDPTVRTVFVLVASSAPTLIASGWMVEVYSALPAQERRSVRTNPSPKRPRIRLERFFEDTWRRVGALYPAWVISVLVLIAATGRASRFDAATATAPHGLNEIAGAGCIQLLLALLALGVRRMTGRSVRERDAAPPRWTPSTRLELKWPTVALLGGAGMVGTVVPLTVLEPHEKLWAAGAAVLYGLLIVQGLLHDAAWVHAVSATRTGTALCLLQGCATSSALYWLLSTGIWSGTGAAQLDSAIQATLIVLVGWAASSVFFGMVLWATNPVPATTLHRPPGHFYMDFMLFAGGTLYAVVIPAFAVAVVSRSEMGEPRIVIVVTGAIFLLSLGGLFWHVYGRSEAQGLLSLFAGAGDRRGGYFEQHVEDVIELDVPYELRRRAENDAHALSLAVEAHRFRIRRHFRRVILLTITLFTVGAVVWLPVSLWIVHSGRSVP
jgi:hypothetical protein